MKEKLPYIRIKKIILDDFRNIKHAEVDIPGGKIKEFKDGESSILGLYGQNGSGKTSLLMAIEALGMCLKGLPLNFLIFSSCIRHNCEKCKLTFEFSAFEDDGAEYDILYSFCMSIEQSEHNKYSKNKYDEFVDAIDYMGYHSDLFSKIGDTKLMQNFHSSDNRIIVTDEVIQVSGQNNRGEKIHKQVVIDTSEATCKTSGKTFGNKSRYSQFTENSGSDIDEKLYKEKITANIQSKSFVFSDNVFSALIEGCNNELYKTILSTLKVFGDGYLFSCMMSESGMVNLKQLIYNMWYSLNGVDSIKLYLLFDLTNHCNVPEQLFPLVKESLKSVGKIVGAIVPGFSLDVSDLGKSQSEIGHELHAFDIISCRDGVRVPLQYESAGILRMISFVSLIVAAYNHPSITVVIDEIDSGIFEYILGELLIIMKESAKGQLIFTSHNLRPLEVLPRKNLLFTTTNPENRFCKLDGISGNNNLRDCYFRSIILGSEENGLYSSTDTFSIEQALFEAGHPAEN